MDLFFNLYVKLFHVTLHNVNRISQKDPYKILVHHITPPSLVMLYIAAVIKIAPYRYYVLYVKILT